ncbi:MAG: hypothetical protein LAN62_14420 [Acidobacteriia bacterium]|nr:hypothetical protein [Terriglobia bacterium]
MSLLPELPIRVMPRLSRTQLLGCSLLLAAILALLLVRYLRLVWWAR